ncbi:MAG TPA: DUF885 domain-containing protein [Pseudomonadales bacterium]
MHLLGLALLLMLAAVIAPAPALSAAGDAAALHRLFADEREHVWRTDPLFATTSGVHRYDDRLPDVSPAAQAAALAADRRFLERLHAIDRGRLDARDRISYDLFEAMVAGRILLAEHREWRMPLNSDSGFHTELTMLHRTARPRTPADYRAYLARLEAIPDYVAQQIDNMRQGIRDGFTLPGAILDGVAAVIDAQQFARVEDVPLWEPFAAFPDSVPEAERAELAAAGRRAIADAVIPAFAEFQRFFESEYRPAARRSIAASELPGGRAYYEDLVRYYTTLPDATPEQIHRLGLAEVARIEAEMQRVIREVGFEGDVAEFIEFLRSDPRFYADSAEELLKEAAWIAKRIDGRLPELFGHLPRTPYGIRPVPADIAPNYTSGRYNGGPVGAAGEYWVNTYALDTRPLYTLPALTLHEAVPGHHLQNALARELTDLPAFRRELYPHAFGEGWGLYAERLGEEIGIYTTPYEYFGRLTYDMWRACRLVVDTGMHAMGWSRQRALDYLADRTALSRHEVRTEIDRYIGWPGQALAYKVGELKIAELRERAAEALGDAFDVRAFHDAVLANGGVTLPVLERQIDEYIRSAAGGRPEH